MKLGRLTVGIIAGVVALLVLFLVQFVQTQVLGSPSGRLPLVAFVGAGVGVFWVADRLGILASAYTEPGLGLRTSDESDVRADSQARERDGLRARLDAMLPAASNTEPELLSAVDLIESNIGVCEWNRLHNSDLLTVSDDGQTIGWESRKATYTSKHYPPAWVQASTELKLGFLWLSRLESHRMGLRSVYRRCRYQHAIDRGRPAEVWRWTDRRRLDRAAIAAQGLRGGQISGKRR